MPCGAQGYVRWTNTLDTTKRAGTGRNAMQNLPQGKNVRGADLIIIEAEKGFKLTFFSISLNQFEGNFGSQPDQLMPWLSYVRQREGMGWVEASSFVPFLVVGEWETEIRWSVVAFWRRATGFAPVFIHLLNQLPGSVHD